MRGLKVKKSNLLVAVLLVLLLSVPVFADFTDEIMNPRSIDEDNLKMYEANIKLGVDFGGSWDTNEGNVNVGDNVSFAVEYYKYFNPYIAAGAGILAQIPRGADGISGSFGFAPAYIGIKVRSWPQEPGMYGYIVGHIGYNLFYADGSFNDDLKISNNGGVYYAGGIGIVYKAFIIEGIYGVNNGSAEDKINGTGKTLDVSYGKFTLSVGYMF